MPQVEGVSRISEDPEAGFRAATKAAVDTYKAEHGRRSPASRYV